MLKVHLADGQTQTVDLSDEGQARQLLERLKAASFQDAIRGMSIAHWGTQFSLPRPAGDFTQVFFTAEHLPPNPDEGFRGGQRIVCMADNVTVKLMVPAEQRAARITLNRTGKQRFNPMTRD